MSEKASNKRAAVTIIGKAPPPIGGVTIHVARLLQRFTDEGIPFEHFDPGRDRWRTIPTAILRSDAVHVHVSNSLFRLLLILLCMVLRRRTLLTLHGNLGRHGPVRNAVDRLAIRLANKPILLNEDSISPARLINPRSELIPAFIPPSTNFGSPGEVSSLIEHWRGERSQLFCSNASARGLDKHGSDIYGAELLLEIFTHLPNSGLVFSDPSGSYSDHFSRSGRVLPSNVLLISKPHNFVDVLTNCDCMIRATTTDGDSISVKEALYLGVNVIASDCVSRPAGCFTYPTGDSGSLARLIEGFHRTEVSCLVEDAFPLLINAYRSLGVRSLQRV